jgi:steroid delta-isomerase-like uncharacterized protein
MKKLLCVIPLAILFCFTFACQNKAEKAELEKYRTQAKLEEQNKAIVSREWDAYSKGDYEAFKQVVAPVYVWYDPSGSVKPRSLEETIEYGKMLHKSFPDLSFSIEEMFAGGDRVVSRYIMRGTQQREFAGLPATGNKSEMSGMMIHRIENGKVVEEREESDMLGFMEQLGMELKPKVAEKK